MRTRGLATAAIVLATAGGCGEAAPAPTRSLRGEVHYEGALRGTLVVTAYEAYPPSGEPLASLAIEAPVFPQAFELVVPPWATGVYVLAMLDASPEDGFRYHSLVDAGGAWPELLAPAPVSLGPVMRADFALVDPRPGLPSP